MFTLARRQVRQQEPKLAGRRLPERSRALVERLPIHRGYDLSVLLAIYFFNPSEQSGEGLPISEATRDDAGGNVTRLNGIDDLSRDFYLHGARSSFPKDAEAENPAMKVAARPVGVE